MWWLFKIPWKKNPDTWRHIKRLSAAHLITHPLILSLHTQTEWYILRIFVVVLQSRTSTHTLKGPPWPLLSSWLSSLNNPQHVRINLILSPQAEEPPLPPAAVCSSGTASHGEAANPHPTQPNSPSFTPHTHVHTEKSLKYLPGWNSTSTRWKANLLIDAEPSRAGLHAAGLKSCYEAGVQGDVKRPNLMGSLGQRSALTGRGTRFVVLAAVFLTGPSSTRATASKTLRSRTPARLLARGNSRKPAPALTSFRVYCAKRGRNVTDERGERCLVRGGGCLPCWAADSLLPGQRWCGAVDDAQEARWCCSLRRWDQHGERPVLLPHSFVSLLHSSLSLLRLSKSSPLFPSPTQGF